MLQYFNLDDINEYKHVIRLTVTRKSEKSEFDISKKFVKFDERIGLWYYHRLVPNLHGKEMTIVVTFLEPTKAYIAELNDKTVETSDIAMIKDIMSVDEIEVWRGIANHAKESYRG